MPRIMPEARYFSMPSTEVGAEVLRKPALNCWPWVRSFTQSPAAIAAASNNGDQLTVATRLDPDDTIAVLRILVRDALNQPGKDLPIGSFRLRLHEVRRARGVSSPALYASQILLKDSLALVAMVVFC